jgi:hypothetical protein
MTNVTATCPEAIFKRLKSIYAVDNKEIDATHPAW